MREKESHKIEVHASGICFDSQGKVLIAKREMSRSIYPDLWETGGGQVHAGETFEGAVKRQFKEELGTFAEPVKILGAYKIEIPDEEQKIINGISFACKITGYLNGRSPQTGAEHSEWKLIAIEDLDKYEFIPGLKSEIKKAKALLQSN